MRKAVSLVFVASLSACEAETRPLFDGGLDGVSDAVADSRGDAESDAPTEVHVTQLVLEPRIQYAVMSDGTVRVRGESTVGALGTGSMSEPTPVTIVGLSNIADLVTNGFGSACARSESGAVWCWGRADHNVLGLGSAGDESCAEGSMTVRCRLRPERVPYVDDAVSIDMGGGTTCVARRDGSMWCWGFPQSWAPTTWYEVPVPIWGVTDLVRAWALGDGWIRLHRDGRYDLVGGWESVTIPSDARFDTPQGSYFGCYRLGDGTARCFGLNSQGQLGNGSSERAVVGHTPVDPGLSRVRFISPGVESTCAVTDDGLVRCWGGARNGGLGFIPTETCAEPSEPRTCATRPGTPVAITDVERVFVGVGSACALRANHEVWCWGALGGLGTTPTRVEW